MDRADGYITDVQYTQGYYAELSPSRIDLALLCAGQAPIPEGPCCELGFGQGLSMVMHAASHPDRAFYGNDFIPSHVVSATHLAEGGHVRIQVSDDSFADYLGRPNLPDFALIVLHGVWSWISATNRERIVDFLKRKLMPGGVVYVSYNVGAGWIGALPLRELLALHAARMQPQSLPSSQRIGEALKFLGQILNMDPATVAQVPALKRRVDALMEQDARYLAHEYLNADWHITTFAEVAQALSPAKLQYACSSMLLDQINSVQLTDAQQQYLAGVNDTVMRQSIRDFFTAHSFRRDIWVKGASPLSSTASARAWRSARFVPVSPPSEEPVKVRGSRGVATLPEATSNKLLRLLHESTGPVSFGELRSSLEHSSGASSFLQILFLMLASGRMDAARSDADIAKAREQTSLLNGHMISRAVVDGLEGTLISPVTGVAAKQTRLALTFFHAVKQGAETAEQAVPAVARHLLGAGEQILAEGKPVTTIEAAITALRPVGQELDGLLPVLRRLEVL